MNDFADWLTQKQTDVPVLNDFIGKSRRFFSETGFDSISFEKAVAIGLKKFEKEAEAGFKAPNDATP